MRKMRLREVRYLPKVTQLVLNSSDAKTQTLYQHLDLASQAGLPSRPETEEYNYGVRLGSSSLYGLGFPSKY